MPKFKPVSEIEWTIITVNYLPTSSLAEVERSLSQEIDDKLKNAPFQLVELTIANSAQLSPTIRHLLANGDVLEHQQDQNADNGKWWVYDLLLHQQNSLPSMTDLDEQYWQQAAQEVFTPANNQQNSLPSMTDLDEQYWQQAAQEVFTPANIAELTKSLARDADLAAKLITLDLQQLKQATTQLLRRED